MPTQPKLKSTLHFFSKEQVAAAKTNPGPPVAPTGIDWKKAIITHGGGTHATQVALRTAIAARKRPPKQSVAIRLDPDVLAAFRAEGPGWQTRMNAVLRDWIESRSTKLT